MAVTVRIPTAMRTLTQGQASVTEPAGTVAEVLASLENSYPGFAEFLFDAEGDVRRFLDIFVGQDSIRTLDGLATELDDGVTLLIMSAVAGG